MLSDRPSLEMLILRYFPGSQALAEVRYAVNTRVIPGTICGEYLDVR
jgi:hypothetical protein